MAFKQLAPEVISLQQKWPNIYKWVFTGVK